MVDHTLTRDHCEAALCIWEAMLESRHGDLPWHKALNAEFDRYGTSAMRMSAIDKAAECDAAWLALSDDERDVQAFDWEFVPRYLAKHYAERVS